MAIELIKITKKGIPAKPICSDTEEISELIKEITSSTAELYATVGYVPPWIGYMAVEENECAGTCAFKAPPEKNRVEIAYFTFPGNEGKGIGTRMAQALVRTAFEAIPELVIAAQTLPEENASTSILKKLGFRFAAELEDPEDGKVWE